MLKEYSSESLAKLTHDSTSLEKIQLKDKINIFENIIDNPDKMNKRIYMAAKLYDEKGNFNTDHLGYQLVGALAITSVPISILFGAGVIAAMFSNINVPQGLVIASSSLLIGETIIFTGVNAHVKKTGAKMVPNIKYILAKDLEKNGYQINTYENEKSINFDSLILSLINKVSLNQYHKYEVDLLRVKELYKKWLSIKSDSLAIKGTKKQVPQELENEYHSLYQEITNKIRYFRYEDNNTKLLTHERIGGISNGHIQLIEEDPYILEISNLISKIPFKENTEFSEEIKELKEIATNWIAKNLKSYRDIGVKTDPINFPYERFNQIKEKIQLVLNQKNTEKTLKKKR